MKGTGKIPVMGRIFSHGPKRGQPAVIIYQDGAILRMDMDGIQTLISASAEIGRGINWRVLLAETRKSRTARDREKLRVLLDAVESHVGAPVQTVPYKGFRKHILSTWTTTGRERRES